MSLWEPIDVLAAERRVDADVQKLEVGRPTRQSGVTDIVYPLSQYPCDALRRVDRDAHSEPPFAAVAWVGARLALAGARLRRGSGAFVGSRVVLTAAHCVCPLYRDSEGQWTTWPVDQVWAKPGSGSYGAANETAATHVWVPAGWLSPPEGGATRQLFDVAVIVLAEDVGRHTFTPRFQPRAETSAHDTIHVAGNPTAKVARDHMYTVSGTALGVGQHLVYDLPTVKGMSGGPIFDRNLELLGLHQEGAPNCGLRFTESIARFLDRLGVTVAGLAASPSRGTDCPER